MKKSKKIKKTAVVTTSVESFAVKTEWTCTSKITEWINTIIKDKNLPLGNAEVDTKIPEKKRPDVIIYKTPKNDEIVCLLEFKKPIYEPDDEENLKEPARKKATQLKVRYFGTSNFQSLILFNTERVNSLKPIEEQIVGQYTLSLLEDLNEIEQQKFRSTIYSGLEKFLLDLAGFVTGKKPEPLIPIDQHLVWRLYDKVNRLSQHYKRIIEDEYHKNSKFRLDLKKWFGEQMWEFVGQEQDFIKAARQASYLLINKLIFYKALQTKRPKELNVLTIPEDLTRGGLLKRILQVYFNEVLEKIDYDTIYSADFIDTLAFRENESVNNEIQNLVKLLKRYDFSALGYDIIGYIFEKLIPSDERHNLGQYFTNSTIVDIILRFCSKSEDDKIIDPACGAGTFLVRAYHHKKLMNANLKHENIINTLWGVDIAKFPVHLATINLAINDLSVDKNFPNIIHKDFFELNATPEGLELSEDFLKRWRKVRIKDLSSNDREITYPRLFDCIVGNPPYTRQEEISEIIPQDEKYKTSLIERATLDLNGKKIAEISKRSGIHAYFFIHGTKFLKQGGRFGFIVSNSWLDTDYGKGLQEFFLKNYKIISIIESKVERWFEDADINTCIVILEKCNNENLRNENYVRFVYLKKPLSDLIPNTTDTWEKQKERIDVIDNIIKTILFHNDFYENEDLRIFPKKQKALWDEGYDNEEQKYIGAKWGKYLKAPQIFFKILEKGKDKFVLLKEVAEIRRGYIPWPYEVFRLDRSKVNKLSIKDKYIKETMSSPTEWNKIIIDEKVTLPYYLLLVDIPLSEIKDKNLKLYLEKISNKVERAEENPENWYILEKREPFPIIYPRTPYNRHIIFLNKKKISVIDHIEINPKDEPDIVVSIFNSTIYILFREIFGRGLGGGTLKNEVIDLKLLPFFIPKIYRKWSDILRNLVYKLNSREVEDIENEIGALISHEVSLSKVKLDRRELDKIIMGEILGLTDEEQLEVYRAVVDLVKSRIDKAKSVKNKKKKFKDGINIDLLVKTVLTSIGEKTIGKFYKEKILSQPCYEKILPEIEGETVIEENLLGWSISAGKTRIDCNSELEASYLKNFIGTRLNEVKIPKNEKYLKEILKELEEIRNNIDIIIKEEVFSILNPKIQNQVLPLLWQEIMKV